MSEALKYRNKIAVAAHRGNSKYYPENTMSAYRSAVEIKADQIEIDIHMTKDGEIVMMHDAKVDRTTDGHGFIRDMTLSEVRSLDAGSWKGEQFKGEKVPLFEEFLSFMSEHPEMTVNAELKDYPSDMGDKAFESAKKSIALMDKYGVTSRATINTWSGELNEWLDNEYDGRLRIHAYFPQELMGANQKRFVLDYAHCVCLWGTPGKKVPDKNVFDFVKSYGVEPWVYYWDYDISKYDTAIENGAVLFTDNDPVWLMDYLRSKGLHD